MNKSKILSKGKREAQKNELTVTTTERRWDSRRATKNYKNCTKSLKSDGTEGTLNL